MILPNTILNPNHDDHDDHNQVLASVVAGGPRVVFINLRGELPQILLPTPLLSLQKYFHHHRHCYFLSLCKCMHKAKRMGYF